MYLRKLLRGKEDNFKFMDFNEIKDIVQKSGGKFIIVENGKPEIVITSFEDFKKELSSKNSKENLNQQTILVPQINQEFPISSEARNKVLAKEDVPIIEEKPRIPKELEEEPLKIEDLPF